MKDTEKRLKEKNIELIEDLIKVVSETDVLDTEDVENYYRNADRIINGSAIDNAWKALGLKGKLKELFDTSIQQAIAEERARVRGNLPEISVSALSLLLNDCANCGQVINRSFVDDLTCRIQDEYKQKIIASLD